MLVGGAVLSFAALALLFWILESLWPEDRAQPRWRRDSPTDLLYWFLGYGSRFLATVALAIVIVILMHLLPHTGLSGIGRQPRPLQAAEVLGLGDLLGYWMHRIFHTHPLLWPVHAVHHSPEQLDWLAAARVHPLDTIATRLAVVVPLYLLGFTALALGPYAVFLAIYPIYLHANVSWDYGPLRYLVSSPSFHRWHHSSEREALDKNFSSLFPLLDVLFGTAYFPHRPSTAYGLYRERLPRGVIGQTLYPFRKWRRRAI